VNARQEWAQNLIARHPSPPTYGSPEWLALPEAHPAKIAAVIIAAECWAVDGDQLEDRLRTEILALSRADKQAQDAEYVAGYQSWAKTWAGGVHHHRDGYHDLLEAEFWDWIRGAA
jgi:hypothetical protein